ncbi:MAG: response regulator transcription factor [Bacilli bacterium]
MAIAMLSSDKQRHQLLIDFYEIEGVNVDVFTTYQDLIDSENIYTILLVDEVLEGLNVYQVCEVLKYKVNLPIIMFSKQDDVVLEKRAFDVGCVDYIKEPYSIELVSRRIKVHDQSVKEIDADEIEIDDNITIDLRNNCLIIDGENIALTLKQFEILCYLVKNPNRIVSRQELLESIWGRDISNRRIVDTHIKNIRKLVPSIRLETISGSGYRYRD